MYIDKNNNNFEGKKSLLSYKKQLKGHFMQEVRFELHLPKYKKN